MNKEQQNIAWACLPKEVRDYITEEYINAPNSEWHKGYISALENIYGRHNLTSETEPEEMLTIPRKKVMQRYADANKAINDNIISSEEYFFNGKLNILKNLYGNKCLPDKEQPKPKFKIGDKVIVKNSNQILTIKGIRYDLQKYDCGGFGFVPWDSSILEPYIEK